jgi:hypothetical protein
MASEPGNKVEFLSEEWLEVARDVLNEIVTRHGKPGDYFSLCERFTDAPASIAPSGLASWHFRINGTSVQADSGEINDADVTITTDYQAILPMARLVYSPDKADLRKSHADKHPSRIDGDISKVPPYLGELHNRLAVVTA